MDSATHLDGSNAHMSPNKHNTGPLSKGGWNDLVSADKNAAVHEEIKRMNRLPANSNYATHRLRVLNKILQLLSIQRTTSQEEELQLLFVGLSL